MTQVQDSGTKKGFNDKLKEFLYPRTKLNCQEEALMEIIVKILNAPGTIKITPPREKPYFLVNKELKYCVKVDYSVITVVNATDTIVRHVSLPVSDFARETVEKSVLKDMESAEQALFQDEMKILKNIADRLPNAEASS